MKYSLAASAEAAIADTAFSFDKDIPLLRTEKAFYKILSNESFI